MTTTARTPPQARQRWALALLAFALAALFCFNTAAQVPTATVGGQELKIPPPAGLMNAAPEAPLLVELLRRSFTGDKQLLALFARPQEIAESQVRKRAVRMPVSAVVFTFSEAQDKVLTPQEFLTAQAGMERDFSAAMAAALRQRQAARAASTASPAASTASSAGAQVTDIAPELLGVLSKSDHHLTMANQGTVTRNAGATATTVYAVTTVVLVRGRLLNMVATYLSPSDATLRGAGSAALDWVQAVVAAN